MENSSKISVKSQFIGGLAIMLSALLWSLDGTFIRPKFYILPAGLVVFLEHLLGLVVLSPFLFINWRKIRNLDYKSWGAVAWVSVFGGFLGTIMITKAFFAAMGGQTTFATVIILQKLQPVFALLLAWFILKEKLSKKFYPWAIVAVLSAYVLAFGKTGLHFSEINLFGSASFFAFIAAFAFGSSTVFGKRLVNHLDYRATAALRFGVTSIIALVYILITKDVAQFSAVSKIQWELLALIVFTSGAMAMFLYYFGLKRVSASVATICELFWPVSAIALDYFFNHNVLSPLQIGATVVLLIAIYQVVRYGRAKEISFTARVVVGEGRGVQLGTPTANLDKTDLDMAHGIYTAKVVVDGQSYSALLHFGFKETFNDKLSLEAYLHNFQGDLHNKTVAVAVIEKIRDVKKFNSSEELVKQMEEDKRVLNSL